MRTIVIAMLAAAACGDLDYKMPDAPPPDTCNAVTWYADCDGDGVAAMTSDTTMSCTMPAAPACGGTWVTAMPVAGATDCNDANAAIKPSATEICDLQDNNCNGQTDETGLTTFYRDMDSDGHGSLSMSMTTCGAPTGYVTSADDCDDTNGAIHPGAAEACNGVDDNCAAGIDEGVKMTFYQDGDGDGYGTSAATNQQCAAGGGYVANATDCNDGNGAIHPGVAEVCNGVDDNCAGGADEGVTSTFYLDNDGDGYGNAGASQQRCAAGGGYIANATDCNDGNGNIHPNAAEVCNFVDDNCVNGIDEGVQTLWYADGDGDGYGAGTATAACSSPPVAGYVSNNTDCNNGNGNVHPNATELCFNGVDDNCVNGQDDGARCSMDCDWIGTRWLSWGYDGDPASVGVWATCTNGKLAGMSYENKSGQTQSLAALSPPQVTGGTSTDYIDCDWGNANRWASQGWNAGSAFTFGDHIHCDGTRVSSMSWSSNNALLPGQIQHADIAGQLSCDWNGGIFLSYGFDGSCAFGAGFVVTCSNNHITNFHWFEGGACIHTVE
ncbi:MAG TPA: putative metal-binding motif-containing protein [Kofleriaceae bacterium]|nr:putative metal-binding motif-containing protein [Kofleriaceae bacterium]